MLELIRFLIREELVWNYWSRRPTENHADSGMGDEIAKQRQQVFNSVSVDNDDALSSLLHKIELSSSVNDITNTISSANYDIENVVDDVDELNRCIDTDDVAAVKNMVMSGLKKVNSDNKKKGLSNDYDTSSLAGHTMKTPVSGGPSLKRSMGF